MRRVAASMLMGSVGVWLARGRRCSSEDSSCIRRLCGRALGASASRNSCGNISIFDRSQSLLYVVSHGGLHDVWAPNHSRLPFSSFDFESISRLSGPHVYPTISD